MGQNRIPIHDVCALTIYELINVLFVYKYVSPISSQPVVVSLCYIIAATLFILLLFRHMQSIPSSKAINIVYFSMLTCLALLLTFLMFQFDPQQIRVGRYPAMHDWITRLFSHEFPYASPVRPSGFPFLFVIAMPFYFLGDLGLLQIFTFMAFGVLLHLKYHQKSINPDFALAKSALRGRLIESRRDSIKYAEVIPKFARTFLDYIAIEQPFANNKLRHFLISNANFGINEFRPILLLTVAPMFLYEVVVRSDLFSNMIMLMFYLAMLEMFSQKGGRISLSILGIIGGLLLSTRGIVLLIYIAFFGYFFRRRTIHDGLFFMSMLVGFILTLVPFLIWDWTYFMNFGPFSIQLAHIPNWILILSIAASIYCALAVKSLKGIYFSVSLVLFGVICVPFIVAVLNCGWHKTILKDGFDISYFCFTLPFLLISLDFRENDITSCDM